MGVSTSRGQPSNKLGAFDEVILNVAEAISEDSELKRLGFALGLKITSILRALEANRAGGRLTKMGTVTMLQKWAKTVKQPQRKETLRRALNMAGLLAVDSKCFPSAGERPRTRTDSQSASSLKDKPGEDEMMPDDIQALREKLKTRYLKKYGEIKTSPVDFDSRISLQKIFVDLILILRSSMSMNTKDENIDIDRLYELIRTKTVKGFLTRLAFVGNIGVGKSTLFSKIALGWAMGICLQDIDLLFLESFQDMENNRSFGNIVMNHFPDIQDIEANRIDRYIQKNQRKVVIFIDDLNEKKMDFTVPDSENAVVSIVRGDRFVNTPVLVTTLPYVFDLIQTDENIRELYTLIEVKGFTPDGSFNYITQFFPKDSESAKSLIHFIQSNNLVLTLLAPYPIFCSMLCNIWHKLSTEDAIKKLETFSQVLQEICFSLGEQYFSKYGNANTQYDSHMTKVADTISAVGKIALEGLLLNQHAFNEEVVKPYMADSLTACELGILNREKRLASREIRQKQRKQYIEEFCFPHKLIQEYAASSYLESLFHDNPLEFNQILTDKMLTDYNKYRYVLFFTAAHGGNVGKSVMEALCQTVRDIAFIIEVAFECQDIDALDPVKKLLRHRRVLVPDLSNEHTFSAHIYALETYGKEVIEKVKHTVGTLDATQRYMDGPSHYATALCHMPRLQSLELANEKRNELFFSTMAVQARVSQVMTLKHTGGSLSPAESAKYGKAVVSMPNLQTFELKNVKLGDEFYPAMANGASKTRVYRFV